MNGSVLVAPSSLPVGIEPPQKGNLWAVILAGVRACACARSPVICTGTSARSNSQPWWARAPCSGKRWIG